MALSIASFYLSESLKDLTPRLHFLNFVTVYLHQFTCSHKFSLMPQFCSALSEDHKNMGFTAVSQRAFSIFSFHFSQLTHKLLENHL